MSELKIILSEPLETELYFPLNLMRPVFDIKTGALSNRERVKLFSNLDFHGILCDSMYEGILKDENAGLKINSDIQESGIVIISNHFVTKEIIEFIKNNPGSSVSKDGRIIGFNSNEVINSVGNLFEKINSFEKIEYTEAVDFFESSWDAINLLKKNLSQDIEVLIEASGVGHSESSKNFINSENIYISHSANVMYGSVLDASNGKIFINDDAVLEPFCYVKGPAYIGKKSTLKSGTKIYGPASIGYFSKVAGEISACIYHAFVNKQHDGFTGDSYFCPFVNLGADTVTSNLKNNYSNIRVKLNENEIDTGMNFLGSLIGDHTKTSINTMLNTGSMIGAFANIFGGGFHPKFIKSFSWNDAGKPVVKYDFSKAIVTSELVMSRRNVNLTENYKSLCRKVYDETKFDS